MPTLQIRDLPKDVYDSLAASAEQNRRSLNQEALVILEKGLQNRSRENEKKKALADLKKMSHLFKGVTTEEIVNLIREDRDR